ncbi:COX assembly mitochondrial protein 2 homolog isoform X3 [Mesocricetus auratus]|nr:COX assembly mitochondrial protein 2 homolog isoform X3 [Mesocricetus auratus]
MRKCLKNEDLIEPILPWPPAPTNLVEEPLTRGVQNLKIFIFFFLGIGIQKGGPGAGSMVLQCERGFLIFQRKLEDRFTALTGRPEDSW